MTDTCAYCTPLPPHCIDEHHDGDGLWTCTREPGHDGEHVACGGDEHAMFRWGGES